MSLETVFKSFDVEVTQEMIEKFTKDEESVYDVISSLTEEISLVNIENYYKLYKSLNEQYPINLHQFCKFIPAEYRSELKYICGEFGSETYDWKTS